MIKQANKFQKLTVVFLIALMGMTLVYACGSESDEELSGTMLQISLSCPDVEEAGVLSRTFGIERSLADIVLLLLTVEGGSPPINTITAEFNPDDTEIMIDVLIGAGRTFIMQGLDSNGNVVCQGETVTDITLDTVDIDNTVDIDIECEFIVENCSDGIDNNFDDLIDCGDPDCINSDACVDLGNDDVDVVGDDDDDTPTESEICDDGIDNDGDSFVDCVDQDCLRFPDCFISPSPTIIPSVCPPGCQMCDGGCFCCNEQLLLPAFCANPQ